MHYFEGKGSLEWKKEGPSGYRIVRKNLTSLPAKSLECACSLGLLGRVWNQFMRMEGEKKNKSVWAHEYPSKCYEFVIILFYILLQIRCTSFQVAYIFLKRYMRNELFQIEL